MPNAPIVCTTLALLAAPLALAADFQPYASLDLRGGNTALAGEPASAVVSGQLLLVPAYKTEGGDTLSLTGMLSSSGIDQVIAEDGFFVSRSMGLLRPSWRRRLGGGWAGQLRAQAMRTALREAPGQALFSNAYDFEDYGAGLGLSRDGEAWGGKWSLGLGLDAGHRGYPNYRELGGAFSGGKNVATKDYDALKLLLESRHQWEDGARAAAALTLQRRAYSDSYLVNADGTLDLNRLRADSLAGLSLSGGLPWGEGRELGLDLGADWQGSEQGYFDQGPKKSVPDYYGNASLSLGLRLSQALGGPKSGHRLGLGYSLLGRAYTGRLARKADGAYTDMKQADLEQGLTADLRLALMPHVAMVGGGGARFVSSNNAYDLGARGTFTLFSLALGLEVKL